MFLLIRSCCTPHPIHCSWMKQNQSWQSMLERTLLVRGRLPSDPEVLDNAFVFIDDDNRTIPAVHVDMISLMP